MLRWQVALLLFVTTVVTAHAQSGARPKRMVSTKAPRPAWSAAERGAFFDNAREQLGPEPVAPSIAAAEHAGAATSSSGAPATAAFAWSELMTAEALEAEVKARAPLLRPAVSSPNEFKGGGFKTARREFTNLAALFGVVAEYDGDVRWKRHGGALREALGRAGRNCKVGTDGSYAEAKRRADELEELVRGGNLELDSSGGEVAWSDSVDRPPLMERLEIARTERLKPWTGGKSEFTAHRDEFIHEAALVAALAEIIRRPGYDYAEDESYMRYVKTLQESALAARAAAQQNDFPAAQAAISALGQSCDQCHGDYR